MANKKERRLLVELFSILTLLLAAVMTWAVADSIGYEAWWTPVLYHIVYVSAGVFLADFIQALGRHYGPGRGYLAGLAISTGIGLMVAVNHYLGDPELTYGMSAPVVISVVLGARNWILAKVYARKPRPKQEQLGKT